MIIKVRQLIFALLLSPAIFLTAYADEIAQVTNVINSTEVVTISPSGRRQQLRLAGIKPFAKDYSMNQSAKKRLRTLVLGKTVQISKQPGTNASLSYGGLDIAARLLEEGLATLDEQQLQTMDFNRQQQLFSAQERAIKNHRGHWFRTKPQPLQRYHYPQWPSQGLPVPLTNAPVYTPRERN